MQNSIKLICLGSFCGLLYLTNSVDARTFGEQGSTGLNGANGSYGQAGANVTIYANQQLQVFDIEGSDGGDGEDGRLGRDARACRQPGDIEENLMGASGGDGGNGGQGGPGGKGGDAKIFYENVQHLRNVMLKNSGGRGGQGGRGADPGYGCECSQSDWEVVYCDWDLMRIDRTIPDAKWEYVRTEHDLKCTGVKRIDIENYSPRKVRDTEKYSYKWQYIGISRERWFSCKSGGDGMYGKDGADGWAGDYGSVTLIPRKDIPTENDSHADYTSSFIGQEILLVKNHWVTRNNLRALLAPGSNVAGQYQFLESTSYLKFKVMKDTPKSLEELGDPMVRAYITSDKKIAFTLSGTIERKIEHRGNLTILTITGGFDDSRLKQFSVKNQSGVQNDAKLVLLDGGKTLPLLRETKITIKLFTKQSASGLTVTNYKFRHDFNVMISKTGLPDHRVSIDGNVYTIDTGRSFYPWLKKGYNARYEIKIEQITLTGAVYTSNIQSTFVVGR